MAWAMIKAVKRAVIEPEPHCPDSEAVARAPGSDRSCDTIEAAIETVTQSTSA